MTGQARRFERAVRRGPVPWGMVAIGLMLAPFLLAPTPGDVGGCGQEPTELDAPIFFASKDLLFCQACQECGYDTQTCRDACAAPDTRSSSFPDGCVPLVHDGEVCLRALRHASCDDYAGYVDDAAPSVPGECNFCPSRER